MKFNASLLIASLLAGLMSTLAHGNDALEKAISGEHRSKTNIGRNEWRHPVETLKFFGIKADMTIVEIWPGGGGWYTEVLAPYLRNDGKLYAANYDGSTGSTYMMKNAQKFKDKLAAHPNVYDQVVVTSLMPPKIVEPSLSGTADMVVTFRNLHNWVRNAQADAMFAAMYEMLKSGGTLGLVAHRGGNDKVGPEAAKKGYLAESEALRLATAAGFKFVERSDVNANPKDTKDHPEGVWTLPPSFRLGDTDRKKYAAIGESDRMTLKFTKP